MTVRRKLPNRRHNETMTLQCTVAGVDNPIKVHATLGLDPDSGEVLEIFGCGGKRPTSFVDFELNDVAVIISLALQYGTPAGVLHAAMARGVRGAGEGMMSLAGHLVDQVATFEPMNHGTAEARTEGTDGESKD